MVVDSVYSKQQRQNSTQTAQKKANPRKFYKNFMFKSIIVVIVLVIIPLIPSEPPDFVSTTSVLSKSWELFQLIFVGIVVSYGLFSRRNVDEYDHGGGGGGGGAGFETENGAPKYEGAQAYMSKLLHVSTVFDDDNECGSSVGVDDTTRVGEVQTWRSKYVRNEPMLVVAEKSQVLVDRDDGDKPLLLPVRSLKSRVCDDRVSNRSSSTRVEEGFSRDLIRLSVDGNECREDLGFGVIKGHVRSNSMSLSGSNNVRSRVSGSSEFGDVVADGDGDGKGSRLLSRANSYVSSRELARSSRKSLSVDHGRFGDGEVVKEEETVVLPSPIPWQSRSGRMEVKGESLEDSSMHSLPPSLEESEAARLLKPQLSHSRSILSTRYESQGKSGEDFGRRKSNYSSRLPPPPPPPPPPPSKTRRPPPAKSSPRKDVNRSVWGEPNDFEWGSSRDEGSQVKSRNGADEGTSVGKSVKTARPIETRPKEVENPDGKTVGYNPMSKGSFSEYPKETRDFLEQVLLETDDESESEAENYREERVEPTKVNEPPPENVHDEESDVDKNVDKKADEFIAKFREQIRLQRIESIKKSTGQLKRSSVR